MYGNVTPVLVRTSSATRRTIFSWWASSVTVPTSGIMISGIASIPFLWSAAAASKTARACISLISGYVIPRRQPRCPSIGFSSCSCATRVERTRAGTFSDRARRAICFSSRFTNSCSGGSRKRMVTGYPFIALRIPSKSFRWNGRSFMRAFRRAAGVSATIISRMALIRFSSKNMCSVRVSPIPCAPNARAWAASSGRSALVRTFSRRTASAQDMRAR